MALAYASPMPEPVPVAIAVHDEAAVPVPDMTVDLLPPREDSAHFWGMNFVAGRGAGVGAEPALLRSGDVSLVRVRVKRSKSGRRLQHRKGSRNIFY